MTIGAIARIGTVCEAMIQGIRLRSRVRTWTMPAASTMPRIAPKTKPSMVAEAVIHAWYSSERLDVGAVPTVVFQNSAITWCGEGRIGRSIAQVAATVSEKVAVWLLFAIMAVTCGQFSSTASAYQITMSAATMDTTGMTRPRGETS